MPINRIAADALRRQLADPIAVAEAPMTILRSLCALTSDPADGEVLQELVLRALDNREAFGTATPVLEALVRANGLFPYLDADALSLPDLIAYEFHRSSIPDADIVFHRAQAAVFRQLLAGENVILSAPTSFGKSVIIDAMIATRRFQNIVVVVPTIALIDETRRRLTRRFREHYKIITHPSQTQSERNVFVFTQERVIELSPLPSVDFFVIDEFYKLNPARADDSRCAMLNQAFYKLARTDAQFYLLGPNILGITDKLQRKLDYSFVHEPYHTVVTQLNDMRAPGDTMERLVGLCQSLNEPTIIFCKSPGRARDVAKALSAGEVGQELPENESAASWVADNYHADWHFATALRQGIGVHHGRIPRALAQYVVRAFDAGALKLLVCTSTLIEGVNTKAKNIIIFDKHIDRVPLDLFTFNNIRGRSGRMGSHFIGNVFVFHDPPEDELPFVDVPAFTQADTATDALLLQLDTSDLTARSRRRIEPFFSQSVLDYETLQNNVGLDPQRQLNLGREIADAASRWHKLLGWSGFPTTEQLKAVCDLIWRHFDGRRLGSGSARTSAQLAFMINRLRSAPTTKQLITSQLAFFKGAVDEAVAAVLDFLRLWGTFHFPRLLRAVDRIQRDVFNRAKLKPGDYGYFANRVESLFLDPAVTAVDEYGVPMETARKLESAIKSDGDLDVALARLKALNLRRFDLHPFEIELVRDAQENL